MIVDDNLFNAYAGSSSGSSFHPRLASLLAGLAATTQGSLVMAGIPYILHSFSPHGSVKSSTGAIILKKGFFQIVSQKFSRFMSGILWRQPRSRSSFAHDRKWRHPLNSSYHVLDDARGRQAASLSCRRSFGSSRNLTSRKSVCEGG